MRIHPVADALLRRFPVRAALPNGLRCRITALDQFSVKSGLFDSDEYAPALSGKRIASFIDLGCNAGWFTLWLSARIPDAGRVGLLIDAHPRMVEEAGWHMAVNRLDHYVVVHGAIGLPHEVRKTVFHTHQASSASTLLAHDRTRQLPLKGRVVDVIVPAVTVAGEWETKFGELPVDLMKCDIEGMELEFISSEGPFLSRSVRRIAVEWHKWRVSLAQLEDAMTGIGFERVGLYGETPLVGLAVYDNSALSHR